MCECVCVWGGGGGWRGELLKRISLLCNLRPTPQKEILQEAEDLLQVDHNIKGRRSIKKKKKKGFLALNVSILALSKWEMSLLQKMS